MKRSKEGGRKKNNDEGKDIQVLCTGYSELGWSSPQGECRTRNSPQGSLRNYVNTSRSRFSYGTAGNMSRKFIFMKHVRVVLSSNMSKKIIVREICPKNICPGNISKLYMSEGHATFDNVRNGCSRTIPAQNVRRHNARNICQK